MKLLTKPFLILAIGGLLILAVALLWLRVYVVPPPIGLTLIPLSTYRSGIVEANAAEIVAHDPVHQRLFVTNVAQLRLDVLDFSKPAALTKIGEIPLAGYGIPNYVDIYGNLLAVALEDQVQQAPGRVLLLRPDGTTLSSVTVGPQPDMLTFTPDGRVLLVANEGSPNKSYTRDPEGSLSLVLIPTDPATLSQADVITLDFHAFNNRRDVRLTGKGATLAQDLEPESIAVAGDAQMAWVTLQESNALALVDLTIPAVRDVVPLGFKDFSLPGNGLDPSDVDAAISIAPWPVRGLYQPDGLAVYQAAGQPYLITANEGNIREDDGHDAFDRVADLALDPVAFSDAGELHLPENLGRLKVSTSEGDANGDDRFETLYVFGGRSFSIWNGEGRLVFDSGDQFAQITAALIPAGFNANLESDTADQRSDDHGSEPEGVTVGVVEGRTIAFIGLERNSGIMLYDVTRPARPRFVNYLNFRNFQGHLRDDAAGDVSPEGLTFISPEDSPIRQPLLVVAYEVSGSTTVYAIEAAEIPQIPGLPSATCLLGLICFDF